MGTRVVLVGVDCNANDAYYAANENQEPDNGTPLNLLWWEGTGKYTEHTGQRCDDFEISKEDLTEQKASRRNKHDVHAGNGEKS